MSLFGGAFVLSRDAAATPCPFHVRRSGGRFVFVS